jgi:hypothetical protein
VAPVLFVWHASGRAGWVLVAREELDQGDHSKRGEQDDEKSMKPPCMPFIMRLIRPE